jgi:delta24(24(1))-sterol reductase
MEPSTHNKKNSFQNSENEIKNNIDEKVDKEIIYEFGGPIGVTAMMIFFPMLMYYLWICLEFYNGKLIYPKSYDDILPFFLRMWNHIKTSAAPTWYTIKIYSLFCIFEAFLAVIMPGPIVKGLPIPSEGNKQLEYICNGVNSLYATLIVSFLLDYFNIWKLTKIIDNFGSLMTVAIIAGNLVTWFTYFGTIFFGKPHRMSGNFFYDLFMGAPLNPRIGKLDLKMWAEIRIPWVILFYVSVSAALKQYEIYGTVSSTLIFMVLAHFLYVNACQKGEECIPTTWDIFYEKWGYMLIFWNLAGVPFTYCLSSIYLLKTVKAPLEHSLSYTIFCYTLLLVGYYIWDTANSQKNRFRMQQQGTYIPRYTFPQLPWGTIKNPTYITTKHGNKLLTSGWWGIARKIHYTADLMMALSWGLITGFDSFIPYFYFTFFIVVLVHRVSRDMERCAKKYKEDWVEYCKKVPYIFIPYVY